jgi:hypothetical protein
LRKTRPEWDRYQYANNNPVNFTDPTGESWLSGRLKNGRATGIHYFFHNMNKGMKGIAHKFNGGLRGIAHKFNSSLRGITRNINNSVKTIGHKIDHAVKSKEATLYFMFKASGMTEEEITWMLAIYLQFADKGSAYFSHRYTGHDGNRDPFNGYYTDFDSFVIKMIVIASFVNQELGGHIDEAKLSWLLLMIPMLSPEPVSFADGLAVRHDREWPKNNKHFKGVFDANNHYITGRFKGIGSKKFWQKPLDSIVVGGGGTVLFLCMNYGLLGGCPL